MRQEITEHHLTDENGNPMGGHAAGCGFAIEWQNGPLMVDGVRREPNGAFVEDIIAAALGRLRFYQSSKFACAENEGAIYRLENALALLDFRTKDREHRGVEGTHTV